MLNNLGLGFVFTAKDLASGAIDKLERSFTSLAKRVGIGTETIQSSFRAIGVGLGIFTAGAIAVGASFALANAAGEFETSIAAVAAVSGATAEELDQLRDAAIDAGIATQFSPTEATVGLQELSQAGFNAQESMQLLIPVLDLAAGSLGELTPQTAAGLASQAMKAFGIATEDAAVSVDRMLQAVNVFALSAKELPLGLGTAARGAQAMNQSLNETLISLGLVKNTIPHVEKAATAVAVAMERLVEPKVQQRLRGIGVAVTDTEGHFRPFLDVLGDMAPALGRMTDSQRSAFLQTTFGTEALGGINSILAQVTKGIRTNSGETLRGAAALKYLRGQFDDAGGTAAKFRDRMLDTFSGQKKLLSGSLETLAIVLGQPFAAVFKPIVAIVISIVNTILTVFRRLPAPVKRAFAAFVVGAGAVISLVGAIIAAKAAVALLLIGIKAAGITLGGLVAVVLPAILVLGVLAVAVAGFVVAFQQNVGGIADVFGRIGQKVTLGFDALVQLFTQGGFSGAVRKELERAENRGIEDFAINVFLWVNRIRNFLSGLATGFSEGVKAAGPTIGTFLAALRELGTALGFISDRDDAGTASAKFKSFGTTGTQVGRGIATVFELLVRVFTAAIRVGAGLVQGWYYIKPAADLLIGAVAQLGSTLGDAINALFGSSSAAKDTGSAWTVLGNVIGYIIGAIVAAIAVLVAALSAAIGIISSLIQAVIAVFAGVVDIVFGLVDIIAGLAEGNWGKAWKGLKLVVFGVLSAILGVVIEFAGAINSVVDSVAKLFGVELHWQSGVRAIGDSLRKSMAEAMGVSDVTVLHPVQATAPAPASSGQPSAMPAVAAMPTVPAGGPAVFGPPPPPRAPTTINLKVGEQTLASVVHDADRDAAGRSFGPVGPLPTY